MSSHYKSKIFVALLVFFGIFSACKKEEKPVPPPAKVPYVEVTKSDAPVFREYPAQTYGNLDVELTARAEGNITGIFFKEGDNVKKGQLLYTIDPSEADARVEREKGQVAAIQSNYVNATEELQRIKTLAAMNAVSKRELDAAVARAEATKSGVASAQANLRNQEIQRSYYNVYSPVDGVIGISHARLGDYVARSGTSSILNTVSNLKDVRVRFTVSESAFLKYQKTISKDVQGIKDLELILSDGSLYPHKGQLSFADASIDPSSGTVKLEAQFPNPEGTLRAGQFTKIRLLVNTEKDIVTIPQKAVTEMQGIYQVFVIDKSDVIAVRIVEVGEKVGTDWVVKKGLEKGDRVAIVGNIFIQPGSKVSPIPYVAEQKTE